jgi:hypothetical protein
MWDVTVDVDDRQRAEREYRDRQEQEYREQQEHERLEVEELERIDRLREEEYIRDYYENREQRERESLRAREYYAEYANRSGDDPLTMEGYERWVDDQWQIGRMRAIKDERAR